MKYVIKINSKCESDAVNAHAVKLGVKWKAHNIGDLDVGCRTITIGHNLTIEHGSIDGAKPITVDEFLALETLTPEFSKGHYRVTHGGVVYDSTVYKRDMAEGWWFDSADQAVRALEAVKEVLAAQQRLCWSEC